MVLTCSRLARLACGLVLAATLSTPLAAQTADAAGRTIFEGAYFQQFAPSNALEIVRRVPGFTLDVGSQEVRGFGQAAGNLVINGARPSSKSDTLETILARIPASRVARVEVGPGDLFGAEFSGKPQVLNLVLISTGGLAGNVNASLRRTFTGEVRPEASVSALLRRGASSFNVSAGFNNRPFAEEGFDRLVSLPSGDLIEFREKTNTIGEREAYLSGSWEHNGGENRTAHLNFRAAKNWFDLDQVNDVFPAVGPIRDDLLFQTYRRRDFEVGGDVTRPFMGGGLKLIGLATRRHRQDEDESFNRIASEIVGGFAQELESQRNETVIRLVWSRSNLGGWSVESGLEGALNTLDSDVNLFEIDQGGTRERIDLPVDQAKVTEYRGEAFVNAGRSLSPTLRMDLGLTFEASRLTVTGDAEAERSLRFLKPKAVLDWKPNALWHAQLSVSRTVAQLNFEDFISRAELSSDQVNGGNAELVPQRAWEVLATVERRFLGDGLLKGEFGYNHISLLQDRVPTPEGFDAPGNIGTGRQMFVRGSIDAPLASFGIKGGRFTLNGTLQDTSVEDPYTLRKRRFSGFSPWNLDAHFRQDLGRFAYGIDAFANSKATVFRRNELDSRDAKDPFVSVFAEYRPDRQTSFTLRIDNALDLPAERERFFFFPDRTAAAPSLFEKRVRNSHPNATLTLKKSFG
jgi:hypothetical protein